MKKLFFTLIFPGILTLLFSFFIANPTLAATVRSGCPAEGLVPCGTEGCPCQLCDFFVMFDRIIKFVLFKLVPPVAALMLAIGGVMFFSAAGNPSKISKANAIFISTVWGLAIVYGAWLLINTFFLAIGVSQWTGLKEGWFKYPCQ